MKKKYKALIIGCGKIAFGNSRADLNSHFGAFQKSNKIEIMGAVDIKIEKLEKIKKKFNIKIYDSINLALEIANPDIISLCTPDTTHFNLCYKIIHSKYSPKVIFLEKPCFSSYDELKKIRQHAEKNKIEIIVNHTRRFDKNFQLLKLKIKSGFFGKIKRAYFSYYNGWIHNASHQTDILNYLFDDLLIKKKSKKSFFSKKDNFDVILKFKKNLGLVFALSLSEEPYQIFDLDLHFDKYRLLIDNFGKNAYLQKKIQNSIGESFLSKKKSIFTINKVTPMQNAVNLIVKFLDSHDRILINDYNIESIGKSMKSIW